MRSDKYKNEKLPNTFGDDRWEETQLVFQNRDKLKEEAQRKREYEERRKRDEQYREYLAMRQNPNGNRSPEADVQTGDYSKEKIKRKKPILETSLDRDERKERKKRKYSQKKSKSETGGKSKKKKSGEKGSSFKLKRKLVIVLLIIAILAVAFFFMLSSVLGKIGDLDIDKSNLGIDSTVASELKDYQNIALLGIDARDMDDYDNCRTDAMIILSIDKKNNEIRQISVYRDTYVHVNDQYGYDKITNIHAYAGTEATLHALNENMDLNIEDVVIVNWKAVADGIDALGGIEVEIQESEINEMNKYIKNTAKSIGGSDEQITSAGMQTLNGVQAVTYSRIRKDAATGDYRRNERMKIVVAAAVDKAKSNPLKMIAAADAALPQVKSNMGTANLMNVMMKFMKNDMTDSTGWPFTNSGWTAPNGAWCGIPTTLSRNVAQLHEEYFGQGGYTPSQTVQDISAEISRRTGYY